MDFIKQAQQSGASTALPMNIARIPSPMHTSSASSIQGMAHEKLPFARASPVMQDQMTMPQNTSPVIQSQLTMPQATAVTVLNLQLPEQIFSKSPPLQDVVMTEKSPENHQYHSGVAWTEDTRCVTPSDAMSGINRGCGTPVSLVTTPSNVATTQWRTMICPMPPVKRRPILPSLAFGNPLGFPQLDGGNTPNSKGSPMPSPANLWPSMPSTPIQRSSPSTPQHHSVHCAFPSLEEDIPMLDLSKTQQVKNLRQILEPNFEESRSCTK